MYLAMKKVIARIRFMIMLVALLRRLTIEVMAWFIALAALVGAVSATLPK